jgi:hypothetical protein
VLPIELYSLLRAPGNDNVRLYNKKSEKTTNGDEKEKTADKIKNITT